MVAVRGNICTSRQLYLPFRLAQSIEAEWADKVRRLARIALLRDCLGALENHKNRDLHELSWLAQKMKSLDFSLKHFLVLFLPIERKYTRGLREDQFLIATTDVASADQVCEDANLFIFCFASFFFSFVWEKKLSANYSCCYFESKNACLLVVETDVACFRETVRRTVERDSGPGLQKAPKSRNTPKKRPLILRPYFRG